MKTINWKTGQLLLPEHFKMSEGMLLSTAAKPAQLKGLSGYGFADFQLDTSLLEVGVLKFSSLKLLDQEGRYFELGVNLSIGSYTLADFESSSGMLSLSIIPGEPRMIDQGGHSVEVIHFQGLVRSYQSEGSQNSLSTLSLVSYSARPSGQWEISSRPETPVLSFRQSYFWKGYRNRLDSIMVHIEKRLKDDQFGHASTSQYMMSQMVRKSMFSLEACLYGIDHAGNADPSWVFECIHDLYVSYMLYVNQKPIRGMVYQHGRGCGCFEDMLDALDVVTKYEVKEQSLLALERGTRYFQLERIPEEILVSMRVYLLVQINDQSIDLKDHKLASLERLSLIHHKALPGITLEQDNTAQFAHLFDQDTLVYRVRPGKEWDYVVKSATLGLRVSSNLEGCKLYVFSPDYSES